MYMRGMLTMTIIKKSSSGKGVVVVDDDGRVYTTSLNYLMGMLNGKSEHGFILMARMPMNASPDRYKKSEVYDPNGVFKGDCAKTLEPIKSGEDGMSNKSRDERVRKEAFKDKKVW